MSTNPCCALPEELRNENGGPFGFVAIGRPGQNDDCYRHGVAVEEFLSKPENFGGTWLIDGGWGGPPGPVRVDWLTSESRWQCRGFSAGCRDPFLPTPSIRNLEWITDHLPTAADGDIDGEVQIATRDRSDYWMVNWDCIHPGTPWRHTDYWQPTTDPAPAEPDRAAIPQP
jgi:hypothetical protein